MSTEQYVIASICMLSILFLSVFIVKLLRKKDNGEEINLIEYLASFSNRITVIAEQVILVCNMDTKEFESEEEFKKELIEKVILSLKESASDIGINLGFLNLIDEDSLSDFIYKVIESNKDSLISMVSVKNKEIPVSSQSTSNTNGSVEIYSSQNPNSDNSETTNH